MGELALTAGGIALLSSSFQAFFERLAESPMLIDIFVRRKLNDKLLRTLKTALLSVNPMLEDAEDKQFTDTSVKDWLDELKDIVYDAENILDKIATKDLLRKLDAEFGTIASKVRHFISPSLYVNQIEGEIKVVVDKLEELEKRTSLLGLRVGVGRQPLERLPTTSFVEESCIFGRDNDKEAIINSMLSDDASGSKIGVIAIVGIGGIGKTTLAQLVYNDNKLNKHFDLKAWVCVSDPFDVLKLTKTILEEVGSPANADYTNLNQLQRNLESELIGKKFLLVLDDVWNKKSVDWKLLSSPFKSGAQGSRVIVTTRDQEVASVMFPNETHPINKLPNEDSWLLFVKYAFHNGNSYECLEREAIGRQIVKKCKGLPLAIKAIGGILRSKSNVDEWDRVLRSELWDLSIEETGILPALILSYKHLPRNLKQCFLYCSIFPKDYAFKKDMLILLWMAEGFLPQLQNKTMEEVGDNYVRALVSRSLFQQSNQDEYIMHDLVSDLAKFISKPFTLSHEDDCSREIGSNTRHFSYSSQKFGNEKFKDLYWAERLRTIVRLDFFGGGTMEGKGTEFSLPKLRCLRVLMLSKCGGLSYLPDSIGQFKLLRYLNLSYTGIKLLPDSICKLCNLQILNLLFCKNLTALPRKVHQLTNLRHLNIHGTGIMEMPLNLSRLKCLQTLSTFIVSERNVSSIEELGKLRNLRGSLYVLGLQNVESPTDAKGANLKDKKYLEELVLGWEDYTTASKSRNIVLDSLEPHLSLKSLTIDGYGGTSFPKWVGDASFSHIACLCLKNCKFCCRLPPLWQLPSLQDLEIVGLDGVVKAGREFYGVGSSSMKPFGALKSLTFYDMIGWEEWFSFEGEAFSKLEKLNISNCPKLTGGLPTHLPSLAELFISNCPRLVASLPRASSLCSLRISNCNTVLLNESLTGIHELSIFSCSKLELPMHLTYSSLEYLTLRGCGSLKSFPLFSKLRQLKILNCGDLESLKVGEQHEHDLLLSRIQIDRCPNFAYFPQGGLRAPNLKVFEIEDCRSLRSLPEKMHILLPSLEKLHITNCPQVESFPEGGLPSNLKKICILNCDKLFASRMGWGLQNLPCVRRFTICDKSEDVESFPEEGLLPASLTHLYIEGFPNLKSLDKKGLQHIIALEKLKIWKCPKLECMPEDGLPASLSTLGIFDCPLLKKELEREEGEEWRNIAHVPNKYI